LNIQKRVKLDRAVIPSDLGPGEEGQTEIDGGGIQSVDDLVRLGVQGIFGADAAGHGDDLLGGGGVDAPIPPLVDLGQRASGHAAPDAKVVEPVAKSPEVGFDVSEAFPVGELGEAHAKELVPAAEASNPAVAVVSKHDPAKEAVWEMGDELGEDGTALVREQLLAGVPSQDHSSHTRVQTADRAETPYYAG